MESTLEIRVSYVSPETFERFSLIFILMFLSVRRCAEAMTQPPRLKVKVTLKGHGFLTHQFSVLSISPKLCE